MSFGFGLGDFITVGQHVATAIQTLRDSDTTIERLRLLDFEINELEKAIIERRLSNNGIDITQLRDGQRIREGVASMGQALGSCEEAIIRFRKETDKYRGAFEGNCATKGLDRFRQKLDSVGRRMKIAGDLEAALASLERNLSLSMRRYEMHVKAVDRIIETTGQRQTVEYLRSLSNDMAMVKSHLEGTSRQTVASNTQDIREDLVEVKFDIRKLETMMESMLMRSDKDDVGSMTCQQLCRVDRRTLNQRRYPNASRGYRDSQVERKFRSGSLYSGPNDGLMMMEQANALADQKLRALQAKASIAIIPLLATILLIVKCLKYFLGAIPQEIGYVWNSETGRVTSITILDALGGKLVLPQELCDSFSRLHGVLNVHFEKKPGEEKVKKREYCLMTAEGLRLTRDEDLFHATRPGAQITMFMEVKSKHASNTALLDKEGVQYCPQCGISNYYTSHAGVKALNCTGCSSEVRIFEEVADNTPALEHTQAQLSKGDHANGIDVLAPKGIQYPSPSKEAEDGFFDNHAKARGPTGSQPLEQEQKDTMAYRFLRIYYTTARLAHHDLSPDLEHMIVATETYEEQTKRMLAERTCQYCGQILSRKFDMPRHILDRHIEKTFPCPVGQCRKRFAEEFRARKHGKTCQLEREGLPVVASAKTPPEYVRARVRNSLKRRLVVQ